MATICSQLKQKAKQELKMLTNKSIKKLLTNCQQLKKSASKYADFFLHPQKTQCTDCKDKTPQNRGKLKQMGWEQQPIENLARILQLVSQISTMTQKELVQIIGI